MHVTLLIIGISALLAGCGDARDTGEADAPTPEAPAPEGGEVTAVEAAAPQGYERITGGDAAATVTTLGDVALDPTGGLTISPGPTFDPEGRLQPPTWRYSLSLRAVGREGAAGLALDAAPRVETDGARHTVTHASGVSLHHDHQREGLEQSLSVTTRPEGEGALRVTFEASEEVTHEVTDEGRSARVMRGDEELFVWRSLVVVDAEGRPLPAHMEAEAGTLTYVIHDAGAVYPLLIDPLALSEGRFLCGDSSDVRHGVQVLVTDDLNNDGFDDLVVSQTTYSNPEPQEGRILIHLGTANGPASRVYMAIESNVAEAQFGFRLADGDVNGDGRVDLLVSAPNYTAGANTAAGRVWLYLGQSSGATVINPSPAWTLSGTELYESVGQSVALADVNCDGLDDVVVGASGAQGFDGRVSVYLAQPPLIAGGVKISATPIVLTGGGTASGINAFGQALAAANVNGDSAGGRACEDLLIGAPARGNRGSVDIYLGGAAGTLTQLTRLNGTQDGERYGSTIQRAGFMNNDALEDFLIGSPRFTNTFTQEGKVELWMGGANLLRAHTAYGGASCAWLGWSLAWFGDQSFAAGAPFTPALYSTCTPSATATGWVRLFVGHGTNLKATPWVLDGTQTLNGAQAGERFGFSISSQSNDINGDGAPDLAAGSLLRDEVGVVQVYNGEN